MSFHYKEVNPVGTRLYYEHFAKYNFPSIKIRVWQDNIRPWFVDFYIGDENGKINKYIKQNVIPRIMNIREADIKFHFKPYDAILSDNVPSEPNLPDNIKTLALNPDTTVKGLYCKFKAAFPKLGDFKIYAPPFPDVIGIETKNKLSKSELAKVEKFGKELISVTSELKVFNSSAAKK